MGAALTLTAVIARLFDFVLLRMCQQGRHSYVQVGRVVVGLALYNALAFFGENAQLFGAVGQILQERLFGLSDRLTQFPGFDLDQAVLIRRGLLIGFDSSTERDL